MGSATHPKVRRAKVHVWRFVPLAAIIYAVPLATGDIQESARVLRGLDPWIVLLALAAQVGTVLSLALVCRASLRAVESTSTRPA